MLKKLKSRLLITNMLIISVLFFMALSALYFSVYKNIHDSIRKEIYRSAVEWIKTEDMIHEYNINLLYEDLDDALIETGVFRNIPSLLKNSSFVRVMDYKETTTVLAINEEMKEIYFHVKDDLIFKNNEILYFDYDGKTMAGWSQIAGWSKIYIIMDVTLRIGYLNKLAVTALIVYAATLILVFLISVFLTNKAIKPVDTALEKQKQFVSDASHELRTPLASIITNADLVLRRKGKLLGADSKWIEYILDEAKRMSKLTDEMLYAAKLDTKGGREETKKIFDFSKTVNNHVIGMEAIAYEKKITILSDIERNLVIYGNSETLSQAVIILIDNALKYTDENGQIDISLKENRGQAVFKVKNTGRGLDAYNIDKVFDRFYMADQSRGENSRSYGLGLFIAKKIIENHGGSVSCESSLEGPTVFTIRLKNIIH